MLIRPNVKPITWREFVALMERHGVHDESTIVGASVVRHVGYASVTISIPDDELRPAEKPAKRKKR